MAETDLVLFDDAVARDFYPFTLTRPAGELLLGTLTLRERAERVLGLSCVGYLCAEHLVGFDEAPAPRVFGGQEVRGSGGSGGTVYLCSRAVLHWDLEPLDYSTPTTLRVGGEVCGWIVPAGAPAPTEDALLTLSASPDPVASSSPDLPSIDLGGTLLNNVWDLISYNHDHVASDILRAHKNVPQSRPANAYVLGEYPLITGDDVIIEPGVVFDCSAGPIWLDQGVKVHAFTRLCGPSYIGEDTVLLGGTFTACSIGPMCKVRGEVTETIILGYSNKSHDGFIGHSILGRWVNLGALTTNSNLKNNYSTVDVHTPGGSVDTGLTKMGSLIGDHVKTAIGTMINTGTVIGPGANVFGGMPPKHVPPFAWGDGKYELEKFLESVERAMHRREMELSSSQRKMLSRVYQE